MKRGTTFVVGATAGMSIAAGVLVFAGGCKDQSPSAADVSNAPDGVVRTTFYPTTYFAERIASGLIEIECLLPESEDPIFWRPPPEVINVYQRSSLIILNGAEFEKWAITAPLPRSRVVRTSDAIEEPFITIKGVTHSHGPAGGHSHDGVDGHTWVDPVNASRQAEAIYDAMVELWPEHEMAFRAGWTALKDDLALLEVTLRAVDVSGVALLASHPAYNYLARRRDWSIESFDLDPEAAVSWNNLDALRATVENAGDKRVVMLWESPPMDEAAAALEAIGVASVVFSPAEARPASGDYLSVMTTNAERLQSALTGTATGG